jgi:hypothetical protein
MDGVVSAWRVHDTGLVAVPSRFRRLGGLVRHHRGTGAAWPRDVALRMEGDQLVATGGDGELGRWSARDVTARRTSAGPPVQFSLEVPGAAHLLAAAAGPDVEALLAALRGDQG